MDSALLRCSTKVADMQKLHARHKTANVAVLSLRPTALESLQSEKCRWSQLRRSFAAKQQSQTFDWSSSHRAAVTLKPTHMLTRTRTGGKTCIQWESVAAHTGGGEGERGMGEKKEEKKKKSRAH